MSDIQLEDPRISKLEERIRRILVANEPKDMRIIDLEAEVDQLENEVAKLKTQRDNLLEQDYILDRLKKLIKGL